MSKEKISLLSALKYKGMSFKNRVFMAPMTRNRADHENNTQSGINALYYAQRASAGLIFFGSDANKSGRTGLCLDSWYLYRRAYKRLEDSYRSST